MDPNVVAAWLKGNQRFAAQKAPELPTILVPPDKRRPNYGPGRMFGDMIDQMHNEYDRLGIKPNDHFILHDDSGNPIEYRRLTPEESKGTDWDFQKVMPPDPDAPVG